MKRKWLLQAVLARRADLKTRTSILKIRCDHLLPKSFSTVYHRHYQTRCTRFTEELASNVLHLLTVSYVYSKERHTTTLNGIIVTKFSPKIHIHGKERSMHTLNAVPRSLRNRRITYTYTGRNCEEPKLRSLIIQPNRE